MQSLQIMPKKAPFVLTLFFFFCFCYVRMDSKYFNALNNFVFSFLLKVGNTAIHIAAEKGRYKVLLSLVCKIAGNPGLIQILGQPNKVHFLLSATFVWISVNRYLFRMGISLLSCKWQSVIIQCPNYMTCIKISPTKFQLCQQGIMSRQMV